MIDWCERLRAEFPGFTHGLTDDPAAATVGVVAPNTRAPFRVDRLRADLGFSARFGPEEAFADHIAWHRETAATS
jgi:nucleoside-diphosphate-sugar epimerase